MKTLLSFLALSLCAAAQTIISLPAYHLTLSGSEKALFLENHSGKTVLATFVSMTHANGKRQEWSGYHPATIPDGKSLKIAWDDGLYKPGYSDSPVTEIKLWAAAFSDGELVGVDPYAGNPSAASFQVEVEKRFQAIAAAGRQAASGDWIGLTQIAESNVPDGDYWGDYSRQYAKRLINTRNGSGGEAAAQKLAGEYQKLPEHLWRKN